MLAELEEDSAILLELLTLAAQQLARPDGEAARAGSGRLAIKPSKPAKVRSYKGPQSSRFREASLWACTRRGEVRWSGNPAGA